MAYSQTIKRSLWSLVGMLLCLTGTAQQWHFSVDIQHPAKQKGLGDSQTILVVSNTVLQPDFFGHTTASDGAQVFNDTIGLEQAPLSCLFHLAQGLEINGVFYRVELLDKSQNTTQRFYTRHPMHIAEEERLSLDYDAEVLIVLNQIVLYDIQEDFIMHDGNYFAYLQAFCQTHWTIHHAGSSEDIVFTAADTLTWESDVQSTRAKAIGRLPRRQDALLYLAEETGSLVANRLLPQWESTKRYLYASSNAELTRGLDAFRQRQWQEAISVWSLLLNNKDKKTAAYAAADIAIAYEMLSDLANADAYALRAMNLFGEMKNAEGRQQQQNLRYYRGLLQARQAEVSGR